MMDPTLWGVLFGREELCGEADTLSAVGLAAQARTAARRNGISFPCMFQGGWDDTGS